MHGQRAIVVSILLGLVPLLGGCSKGRGVERLPVHGTVTLANGGKFSGSITFLPAGGRLGPAATTKLTDGSYLFNRGNGPTAGSQKVIVMRVVPRANVLNAIAEKKPMLATKTQWTQSADVADDGEYLHDFTLED